MLHILDGNNRHRAWMACIAEGKIIFSHFEISCIADCKTCIDCPQHNPLEQASSVVFYAILEFRKQDVGELLSSLSRLNKRNEFSFVPATFGDILFQLRNLGESDKSTLFSYLEEEDKAWVESKMRIQRGLGKKSWFLLPIQIMTWLIFKDDMEQKIEDQPKGLLIDDKCSRDKIIRNMETLYRGKTSKFARIANPSNGEQYWNVVLSLPWHEPSTHIATEEKLNMIRSSIISDSNKAQIVRMLDNHNANQRTLEGLPNDKAKVRDWLHKYCFWLQLVDHGRILIQEIREVDHVPPPPESRCNSYVQLCKMRFFRKAFKTNEGGIKFSNEPDLQPPA
ncbi:hypothetical protein GOP47_0001341 [Adiantum capillus-veneris]|uniref:Uncharacterized protein n=1 Tax=Adiantum capillus-veneris TaxID=13818 RepID=A0A9D4V8I2_ADICA|nr:hypothetical protein GOP47_0001341 [Adiantum capillus-veneris]